MIDLASCVRRYDWAADDTPNSIALYVAYTQDKYELPIAVADTAEELARMLGITANRIYSVISKTKKYGYRYPKYRRVVIPEVDDE